VDNLRKIKPLEEWPDGLQSTIDPGKEPEFRWVAPTDLYVDETYQRDLRERSRKLIEKIALNFVWCRLKPPIVVELPDGTMHCIDGQHTAIAAATRRVPLIPVIVVVADTIEMRAAAFVGHNRDRIVMDPLDVYKGLLKANDPDAMDINNVCTRAGVRIRQVQMRGAHAVGDCAAVFVIGNMIKRHSPMKARKVLEALVKAGRGPITRTEVDAVEATMLVKFPDVSTEEMAKAIMIVGDEGLIRARVKAASEKRPQKYALYEAYIAVLEKQRAPTTV
jgi:hypothetical protein